MNIGGGEAADQLVRMMLSGSEVAVRLSGSALKNVLALSMALAKNHKTISGKVNLAKMLRETRDAQVYHAPGAIPGVPKTSRKAETPVLRHAGHRRPR